MDFNQRAISTKITFFNDIKYFLQGGNYEPAILELMNRSVRLFPYTYEHNKEQSHGECDFFAIVGDERRLIKYDVKLPFDEEQGKLLCSNNANFVEWVKLMLKEAAQFSDCITQNHGIQNVDSSKLDNIEHDSIDDNLVLTAFVQEFERRLGQKRKARGGNSLETVVSFLFDYYNFPSTEAPNHFDQDLEVDKWFKCKDGWSIGISCKRTLRERWKQVSQADRGTLSHFKIKELWHIITYDKDLSDDKIVRLGEQGQIFYLMDSSETYQRCSQHIGMKDYVRPLSKLISDIKGNIK